MRWIPLIVAAWCLVPFPLAVGVGRMLRGPRSAYERQTAGLAERW